MTESRLEQLRREVEHHVDRLVPSGPPAALVPYPFTWWPNSNSGDMAIWTATVQLLRRLGRDVVTETRRGFSAARHQRTGSTVLVGGGGNFGDRYPGHDELRLHLLHALPGNRIVCLPQTLDYADPSRLEVMRRAVGSHPEVVLTWRDQRSMDQAEEVFDCENLLVPDMVFALGPLPRPPRPRQRVLALARADGEEIGGLREAAAARGIPVGDWPRPWADRRPVPQAVRLAVMAVGARDRWRPPDRPALRLRQKLLFRHAEARVEEGLSLLGRSSAFVSDRLHAHVLGELMGVPHVALDTAQRKTSSLHDTWLAGSSDTLVVRSAAAACDAVLAMLEELAT